MSNLTLAKSSDKALTVAERVGYAEEFGTVGLTKYYMNTVSAVKKALGKDWVVYANRRKVNDGS